MRNLKAFSMLELLITLFFISIISSKYMVFLIDNLVIIKQYNKEWIMQQQQELEDLNLNE